MAADAAKNRERLARDESRGISYLATRFSALALRAMTATIQVFVYPDAYPMHGVWAAVLLFLVARGAGPLSLDALVARRFGGR